MDASGSRAVQIATPMIGQARVSYNISTIDLGTTTKEQKVEHPEESVAMVVHLIKQDKISKDELKAQVAALTDYIQQWSSVDDLPTTSTAAPQLLSKEQIDKMERRKNLEKTTEDWF